jgi:hypothetical protein
MEQWVTSRASMLEHIAGCGRHVHYCDCCLANMFGMPAVEAFLRLCLLAIKVTPPPPTLRVSGGQIQPSIGPGSCSIGPGLGARAPRAARA